MFRVFSAAFAGFFILLSAVAFAQDAQPQDNQQPDVTIAQVAKYLDKLDLNYEVNNEKNFAHLDIAGDNGRFNVVIVADTNIDVVYIAVVNYLKVPPKHPNCDKVLRRLMQLNWEFNIGKFEWDPSDGEVRLSYALCTDSGLGFEAFSSAFVTVVQSADNCYPELTKLLASE